MVNLLQLLLQFLKGAKGQGKSVKTSKEEDGWVLDKYHLYLNYIYDMYVKIYIYIYLYIHMYLFIYIYVCIYVYMYLNIDICMCIYI